ncbi:hypothetical protein DMO16_23850 [Fictibacillus sp. S7]|nr:hypothetical protein DMO16_23850 [Fictibacillus sp. S7]
MAGEYDLHTWHLGKSLTAAGIVLMINSGAVVLGNLAGGLLFDRLGGYRAILAGVRSPFLPLFC